MRDQSTTDTDSIRCETGLADRLGSGDSALCMSDSDGELRLGPTDTRLFSAQSATGGYENPESRRAVAALTITVYRDLIAVAESKAWRAISRVAIVFVSWCWAAT